MGAAALAAVLSATALAATSWPASAGASAVSDRDGRGGLAAGNLLVSESYYEGNGATAYAGGQYTAAAAQSTAGLQKWVFDGSQCRGRPLPTACATSPASSTGTAR